MWSTSDQPSRQATHVAGAALLPIMGADHYLCVASASSIHTPAHVQSQRLLPLADVLVGSLVTILSARSSSHVCRFHRHSENMTHLGSRGLWCGFLMLVSGASCGASCATSCMARSHQFVVAHHSQNPGWTLAQLKAESSLHCFSTSSSTASSRLCDKLPLCNSVPRPYVFQVNCVLMIFSCLPNASLICRSLWTLLQNGEAPTWAVTLCQLR